MLTTIKGYYEGGQIFLKEEPPVKTRTEVIVTFLPAQNEEEKTKRGAPGSLKGLVDIPDDFNEPLDDLKDYM